MGELQHGTYDNECEGLTLEEVNSFYSFGEDGDLQADEDSYQSNEGQEGSDDNNEESEADMELDERGLVDVIDLEHDFNMEVCFFNRIIASDINQLLAKGDRC